MADDNYKWGYRKEIEKKMNAIIIDVKTGIAVEQYNSCREGKNEVYGKMKLFHLKFLFLLFVDAFYVAYKIGSFGVGCSSVSINQRSFFTVIAFNGI